MVLVWIMIFQDMTFQLNVLVGQGVSIHNFMINFTPLISFLHKMSVYSFYL